MRAAAVLVLLCVQAAAARVTPSGLGAPPPRRPRSAARYLAAAAAGPQAPPDAGALQPLKPRSVYYTRGPSGEEAVVSPATSIASAPLLVPPTPESSLERCNELCRSTPGCDWWEWCDLEVGAPPEGWGATAAADPPIRAARLSCRSAPLDQSLATQTQRCRPAAPTAPTKPCLTRPAP